MIVVDSSALVAILRRESEADSFLRVIAAADGCLLSSVSLLETSMVLAGRTGAAASSADLDALIARAAMQVVAQDAGLVDDAREAHPASLNLGDCASYAIAKAQNLPLLFKGRDFSRTDLQAAI